MSASARRSGRTMAAILASPVLLLVLAVRPTPASAAGYHFPDLGTVALSRGGAFVARADDPTAIYYNPAGAAFLRGTHIFVGGNLLSERIRFQRRQYSDRAVPPHNYPRPLTDQRMPAIENDDAPFFAPFIAVSSDLGFLRRYRLRVLAASSDPTRRTRTPFRAGASRTPTRANPPRSVTPTATASSTTSPPPAATRPSAGTSSSSIRASDSPTARSRGSRSAA